MYLLSCINSPTCTVVSFEHEEYVVNEGENLQPVLILSNPVSMPMIVEILSSSNGSATGKQQLH